ncbi:tetratricopeptide repeat protein [Kushneria sp. Sum13]|uniref:tetratricopeptide repeat protein n=1 Tax=Kushneria sp. Sum13 TaxID=3459196 RepID=UPI0040465E7D
MVMMRSLFNFLFVFLLLWPYSVMAGDDFFSYSDVRSVLEKENIREIEKMAADNAKYSYVAALAYLNGVEIDGNKVDVDKKKGICFLKKSSEKGFAAANYSLGNAYYKGYGVKKDASKWLFYTERAAKAGYPDAQKSLAQAYSSKKRKREFFDLKKSAYWYEEWAKSGDPYALTSVGNMYNDGVGVKKNKEKAFYWYNQAVQQDFMSAQREIASLYASGEGAEKDLVMAYMMYDLGGTAGIEGKKKVAQEMTEDQIKEAITKSRRWQEDHKAFRPSYSGLEYQPDGSYR